MITGMTNLAALLNVGQVLCNMTSNLEKNPMLATDPHWIALAKKASTAWLIWSAKFAGDISSNENALNESLHVPKGIGRGAVWEES